MGRYQYSISPLSGYEGLGVDWSFIQDPKFWTTISSVIQSGVGDYVAIINAKKATTSDPNAKAALTALPGAIASGGFTAGDADKLAKAGDMTAYLPWIVGGAAVLIMGMFLMVSRR